jgi:hypothetical protein
MLSVIEELAADQKQNENTRRKRTQLFRSRRFNARAGERLVKPTSAPLRTTEAAATPDSAAPGHSGKNDGVSSGGQRMTAVTA